MTDDFLEGVAFEIGPSRVHRTVLPDNQRSCFRGSLKKQSVAGASSLRGFRVNLMGSASYGF